MHLAGVDGYRDGWVVASRINGGQVTIHAVSHISQVLSSGYDHVGIDIPIGLVDGRRPCDVEAKRLLGVRHCCVFYAPARSAIWSEYDDAKTLSKSLGADAPSRQCWSIVPKIREVERAISPGDQRRVIEIHPEVTFAAMNGGMPLMKKKASQEGKEMRRQLLERYLGVDPSELAARGVRPRNSEVDDIYDAIAALWTLERRAQGDAKGVCREPAFDPRGLRMEIWY